VSTVVLKPTQPRCDPNQQPLVQQKYSLHTWRCSRCCDCPKLNLTCGIYQMAVFKSRLLMLKLVLCISVLY